MDILFNIGQAFVMGLIAFTITRWGYVKQIKTIISARALEPITILNRPHRHDHRSRTVQHHDCHNDG